MKSLTIHKLDNELAKAIEQLAYTSGLSQNKVIKKLLRKALGFNEENQRKSDFSEFCGIWSKDEAQQFDNSLNDFETIDKNLWQ